MKIEIYINNKPISDYSPEELAELKEKLTQNSMKAAGYKKS